MVERGGDLLVRVTAKVVQLNHLALLNWQLLKSRDDHAALFALHRGGDDIGLLVGELEHARLLSLGADKDWPGAHPPKLVDAHVAGHRAQPRRHLAALVGKACASLPYAPKHILHQIFRQRLISNDAQHRLVDVCRISIVERFESGALTCRDQGDQLVIRSIAARSGS